MIGRYVLVISILLSGMISSAKRTFIDDILTTNNSYYKAEYDIVDINVYIKETIDKVFIVEADILNDRNKGLFVIEKDGDVARATKILDNGQCITSDMKTLFFGATDGIYTYNVSSNRAEKYGSINADVIDIEKHASEDVIYIVTRDNKLYTITEKGNKMNEHKIIKNAQEIVLDTDNNLYYFEKYDYSDTRLIYQEKFSNVKVLVGDNVVDISGLPEKYYHIKLLKVLFEQGTIVAMNNNLYHIFPNSSSSYMECSYVDNITAYYLEVGLILLFGCNRELYFYDILKHLHFNLL